MRESQLWATMREGLRRAEPRIFLKRIENAAESGTPDLYFKCRGVSGWIELKRLEAFPVRESTIARVDHFTPAQQLWIRQHGPGAWLFVQVGAEYFLFDHLGAQLVAQGGERARWEAWARDRWLRPCNWEEVIGEITSGV